MRALIDRILNRETISYLVFGVLTTLVNYVVFYLALRAMGEELTLLANGVAFVAAVTFAYLTNKTFVFQRKSFRWAVLKKELPAFLSARILSFIFEEVGLLVCVDYWNVGRWELLGIDGVMIAKVVLSVIVVIINYILSKFLVFKPSDTEKDT